MFFQIITNRNPLRKNRVANKKNKLTVTIQKLDIALNNDNNSVETKTKSK